MGWSNNVHLRLQTHALTWGRALVGWAGVGWGNNVHLRLQTHALTWGQALSKKKLNTSAAGNTVASHVKNTTHSDH